MAVTAEAVRVGEDLRRAQRALQDAQAEERRRIRRDLHDGVGPTLASIHLRLLAHRRRLPDELSVDDIVDQTSDAIREVRRIVEGLQPSVLEDFGLVPALQILAADTREASGIDVTIDTDSDLSDIPAHIATTSYRVVAEGLANVVRHSQGSTCSIHLTPGRPPLEHRHRGRRLRVRHDLVGRDGAAVDRQQGDGRRWRRLDLEHGRASERGSP